MRKNEKIPSEWNLVKLGELGEFKNGINKSKEDFGHGVPFVNLMDVFGKSRISVKDFELVNASPPEIVNYNLIKGDVIFIRSSVKPQGVGLTALIDEDLQNTVYSGFLIRFRDTGKLYHTFKRYCFHSPDFRRRLIEKSTISANTNINQDSLSKLDLLIPPIYEQKRIAEILATWDEAIALTDRIIEATKKRRKAFSERLLKGQLGAEWHLERLGNISRVYSGGTPSRSNSRYFEGNIPWIKSGEVNKQIIKDTEERISQEALLKSSAKMVNAGTILVAMYGATAGKIAISEIDAAINQAILAIVPSEIDRDFLYYSLKNEMDHVIRKVQGGQPNLNAQIIKETKIFLPSLERQKLIGQSLKILDIEIRYFEQLSDLYQQQKRGLMQKLLTGEWRVAVQEAA